MLFAGVWQQMETTEDLEGLKFSWRCNLQRLAKAKAMMKSIHPPANIWWQPTLSRRHSVSKFPKSLEFVAQRFGGVESVISDIWTLAV